MGCCNSLFDNVPEVPPVIKPDPDFTNQPVTFVSAALGFFGMSHDFGVWENEYPDKSKDRKEKIWLWFRKRPAGNDFKINLENFVRTNPEDKSMGKILYYAVMQGKPNVQFFHRIAGSSHSQFTGFFGDNYSHKIHHDDGFYTSRHVDAGGDIHKSRVIARTQMITKWQSYSNTKIYDGNLGRGEGTLGRNFVLLDVIACGTIVTNYTEVEEEIIDKDADGRVIGHRHERHMRHSSQTFVDYTQYRVTVNGQLWTQWQVPGDAQGAPEKAVVVDTPFFSTVLDGGWAARTKFKTTTKAGIDSALALLFSHVVCTEYNLSEIKNDLGISIPHRPPTSWDSPPAVLGFTLPDTSGDFLYPANQM
jgi:hypothetical protein